MFDMMCWNSARMGLLFTHDTQATANWPDLTTFVHKLASLAQLIVRVKPKWHTHRNERPDMSVIKQRYPAWSWLDFEVRSSYGYFVDGDV